MAGRFGDAVRASSADLSIRELLQQPVTELLGVDKDAGDALTSLGIQTIFDLGSSVLFAEAAAALASAASRMDLVAGDLLDPSAATVAADDLPSLPLDRLKSLSTAQATALSAALAANSIRDLALWPPRIVAHDLVSAASGSDLGSVAEDDASELRPRLGEYPTERVYYDTLVMLGTADPVSQAPLTQPLSLDALVSGSLAFGAPAVGAVATYAQSWFAQGVTLGHMLHSLALAPGEATRVAVIDWARRTTATATESIQESEQLDTAQNHARAVSEVQNAVANEMQQGGSIATGWSKSTSSGSSFGASFGSGIAGVIDGVAGVIGLGGGGGTSSQQAETNSRATSASWTVGSRSVMAEMNQHVNDRTEQHSTSVRNRRATAVREVSQSEHEQVSTRIVANYNHMHALTVQYYEVVQIYRVTVQLHKFVRALFLPFALMDFSAANGPDLVARFRGELLAAALTTRAAELLIDESGRIEVKSAIRIPNPISVAILGDVATLKDSVSVMAAAAGSAGSAGAASAQPAISGAMAAAAPGASPVMTAPGPVASGPTIRFLVTRPGPVAEVVPGDASLVSIAFEDVGIDSVRVNQAGVAAANATFAVPAATDQVDFANPIPLRTIDSIEVKRTAAQQADGSMILGYEENGHRSLAVVPLSLSDGTAMQKAAFLSGDAADRQAELLAHLQSNRAYYTRAVLQSLDAASLVLLLSGVSWNGKPIADQVEPRPVAISGNFLVLRAPAEDGDASGVQANQTWAELLKDRAIDFGQQDARLVPIPSGGVFAEAVLGRSNSAEKLDITRFWNWQDSPIPLQPPEIAPVDTASRATPENLVPGQLGAPVINVMAPTALPEPSGLSAALGALATGSMFRDMSGLAGTQAAAQAASAGTLQAATDAGKIASENYKTASAQATQMGQAAADMWKAWKASESKSGSGGGSSGSAGSGGPGSAGISGDGARVNLGRDLDQRGVSTSPSGKPSSGTPAGAGSGSAGGATGGASGDGSTDLMPPAPDMSNLFSRERAYADEAAAASPDLLGGTSKALAGVNVTPASFVTSGLGGQPLLGLLNPELMLLSMVRKDADNQGVPLTGVSLIPMRYHRNGPEFTGIYGGWTNSASQIYVNTGLLFKQFDMAKQGGYSDDEALGQARAVGLIIVQHEAKHAVQFAGNGNKPPVDYKQMVSFEELAYKGDHAWITAHMTFFKNELLVDDTQWIDSYGVDADDGHAKFAGWLNKSSTEARKLLIDNNLLPKTLGGNANYSIGDLYKTP